MHNRRILAAFVRASLLSSALVGVACQPLFGIEQRPEDPVREGCTLPTVGAGQASLRIGNLVPADAKVDVCVRSTGGEYARPLLRGGGKGNQCQAGLAYPTITAPFGVAPGSVDVKVIPVGANCAAKALSEITKVKATANEETTVVRIGPPNREELRAYSSGVRQTGEKLRLRIINATANSPPYSFGISDGSALPAEIKAPLFDTPLSFGESTNANTKTPIGSVDAHGFIETPGASINVVATLVGQKKAQLLTTLAGLGGSRTIISIGDPNQPFFPVRALNCIDRETTGIYSKCDSSPLATLSVDAFNAQLYGPSADFEKERRPEIIKRVAARESDLMCIVELSRKADRDAIIAAAKPKFPYSVSATTDLDTQPTDPRDKNGMIPPKPTHPSCGGTNDTAAVNAALTCLATKCSTTGDAEGYLAGGTNCISEKCAAEFIPFLGGDRDKKRCFDCLIATADSDEKHKDSREACTVDVRDYFSFRGETPSIILSKFPIQKSETYILPSTLYRRAVHYARVEIETGKFIDYYCAQLIGAYGDTLPYYGSYATTGPDFWEEEELFEVQRIKEFVNKTSGASPAILSGDWSASREYKMGDTVLVGSKNQKVIEAIEAQFVLAVPRTHVPHCTECPQAENPYNGTKNVWQIKSYLHKMPEGSATDASNFFTERVVSVPGIGLGPVSDRFGFNARILRP